METEANIKLKERQALKANEESSKAESKKLEQDLLLDKLTEELKGYQDRLGILEERISSQKGDTTSAQTFLAEATAEMQVTYFYRFVFKTFVEHSIPKESTLP